MICPLCNSDDGCTVLHYKRYPLYIKPIPKETVDCVPVEPLKIVLCNCCGHIYQDICINPSDLAKIYDVIYSSYHSPALSGIGSSLAKEFLSFLENETDLDKKNVLEIGCFDGYFLTLLRDNHGCRVIGCDPSPGAEIAKKMDIEVIKEYFSPSLFNDTFNYVILRGVLEHIIKPIPFLKEVGLVLDKDGQIAIEVPNVIYSVNNGVIGDFFHEHVSYFSKSSLTSCLIKSGFQPVVIDDSSYYIRVIAKKADAVIQTEQDCLPKGTISTIKQLFEGYNEVVDRMAEGLRMILNESQDKQIYIYGGGGHTIGLLSKTGDFLKPAGVIDGDPSKTGKFIPGFKLPVFSRDILNTINHEKPIIIVSSKILQNEIVNSLKSHISRGVQVITLYPTVARVR